MLTHRTNNTFGAGVVKVSGRLVGEQHHRVVHQGAAQRDALRLAAGDLPWASMDRHLDVQLLYQNRGTLASLLPIKIPIEADLGDVVQYGPGLIQGSILEDKAK